MNIRVCCGVAAGAAVMSFFCAQAIAGSAFETYGLSFRTLTMPPSGAGSSRLAGDVLPDGRIIAVTGTTVFVESAVGSGVVEPVATIDASLVGGTTDPAFVRVSDAGRIALGAGFGRPVVVFDAAALGTPSMPSTIGPAQSSVFNVAHFDAAWADSTRLALTAGALGSYSYVSLLDTTSDPASPSNPRIVDNIGGASAGVAFDAAGRLYTGNGFDAGPGGSETGWIRAFSPADWANGAADFEGAGVLIGDVLSAGALSFDLEGNLFVGGGDFGAGDTGYVGVVNGAVIAGALSGGGPIDPNDLADLRRLDPRADPFAFYDAVYNPVTGEVYCAFGDFATGANTWYATVPGPASGAILLFATAAARRRRHE